jgi:hypothetical protein
METRLEEREGLPNSRLVAGSGNALASIPLPADGLPSSSGRMHQRRAALVLAVVCLLAYNANLRTIAASDTKPARYTPLGLWHFHTLNLAPMVPTVDALPALATSPYGSFSMYPIVLPIVISPLYLPADLYLDARGWDEDRLILVAAVMEKLVASSIATGAVLLVFFTLRRRLPLPVAKLLAIAFAFGTNTWVIASQALWQHGLGELLLATALFLVTGPPSRRRATLLGLVLVLAAFNRPPDAFFAATLGAYGLWWARRAWPWVVGPACVPLILLSWFNLAIFHSWLGGYTRAFHTVMGKSSIAEGIAALLVSPTRGLLVFTPFLVLLPLGLWAHWKEESDRPLAGLLTLAFLGQLLFYAQTDWRAGVSWGPRFLTDALPVLIWLLAPAYALLGTIGRRTLRVAIQASIVIQVIGAFWYVGSVDLAIFKPENNPGGTHAAAWDWGNLPFYDELRHSIIPPGFVHNLVRGGIDHFTVDGKVSLVASTNAELFLDGWALDHRTWPEQVMLSADGGPLCVSGAFVERSDVKKMLPGARPAGWSLWARLPRLSRGWHLIEVSGLDSGSRLWFPFARVHLRVVPAD